MFLKIFIITIILVGIAFFGLAIQVIFSKRKKFPDTHVGHNKNMREKGIGCAKCENMGSCAVKVGQN